MNEQVTHIELDALEGRLVVQKLPSEEKTKRYFSNAELLKRYIVYMRKNLLSIYTYQARTYDIKTYLKFLESNKYKTLYKLTQDTLNKYLEYLKENNFTADTQRVKLKSLKAFYGWLAKDNIIDAEKNIFNGFCIYSYVEQLRKTYTPQRQAGEKSPIQKEMIPLIDKFIRYYLGKGYSENGVYLYKRELIYKFIPYLEKKNIASLKDIAKILLAEYQLYVNDLKNTKNNMPLSLSTKQKMLVVIKRFFRFLVHYDYLAQDPSIIIELPRVERGLPTPIMADRELEIFLNAPDADTPRGLRDRAIMEVLYSTGMRNSELCHLKIDDVNFENGLVKITHAKGGIGFQRVVPIGKVACDFIKKYLQESRAKLLEGEDTGYLFLNNFGKKLIKGTLIKYIATYRLKTNIQNKITAHSFRVTCATAMLKNGADVRYIQEQLGHRSLRSTQIYTRVYPKDLKEIHSKTHPRERQHIKIF